MKQMRDDCLRMTRSFGDFYLKSNNDLALDKQAVIAIPEIQIIPRQARFVSLINISLFRLVCLLKYKLTSLFDSIP